MKVRGWQDILADVVESDADPDGWRAVAGDRRRGIGEDMYLAHPAVGVYQVKTFAKNPFELRGVGAEVAGTVDDDLGRLLPGEDSPARFGIQPAIEDEQEAEHTRRRLEETVRTHADAPTTPDALFEDVMAALDSPAFGPLEYDRRGRPEPLDDLSETFEEAEEVLEAEFEDVVGDVDRGFE